MVVGRLAEGRMGALRGARGVTLLELTIAVSIFAVTIAVAAQVLVAFYATMDLQQQRVEAANYCRGVFSQMRTIRDTVPNTSEQPNRFQDAVFGEFPEGEQDQVPYGLREVMVNLAYESTNGTANPLVPTVTVNWLDMRGRDVSLSLTTAITDR